MDFSAVMLILVVVSGAIWAIDALFLAPARNSAVGETSAASDEASATSNARPDEPVLVEYARSFFPIFVIVLILRAFLLEPFRIPSGSMMPTLLVGDFILVNKYNYGIRLPVINTKVIDIGSPARGDIVVFRYPEDPSIPYIKRVVGVPGDQISYYGKKLYINGEPADQTMIGPYQGTGAGSNMTGAYLLKETMPDLEHQILIMPERGSLEADLVVPEGNYFVLGDNRDNSKDSRYWGLVPDENLIGRAFMIWMNWDKGVDFGRLGNSLY